MKTFVIYLSLFLSALTFIRAVRVSPEARENEILLSRHRRQGYYNSGYDRYQQEREQQQQAYDQQQQAYDQQQQAYEEERQQEQKYEEERQQQEQQYEQEQQQQREEQQQRYEQAYSGGYGRYKRATARALARLRRNIQQTQNSYFPDNQSADYYASQQYQENYPTAPPASAPMLPVAVYEVNFSVCRYLLEVIISLLSQINDDSQTVMPIQTADPLTQPGLVVATATPLINPDGSKSIVQADTAQIQVSDASDGVQAPLDDDTDLMIDVS
ncbi:hypothetical protein SNE40_001244 [Patella caerulea]|uniref:Uncharacterized protein n=1 Tax=Patella caerulea TaxID=87958 RepID=A0AAN8KMJ0_PATCE